MVNSLPLQIDNTQQPPASLTAMIPQGQIWKKDGKGWQSSRRKGGLSTKVLEYIYV